MRQQHVHRTQREAASMTAWYLEMSRLADDSDMSYMRSGYQRVVRLADAHGGSLPLLEAKIRHEGWVLRGRGSSFVDAFQAAGEALVDFEAEHDCPICRENGWFDTACPLCGDAVGVQG